MCKRNTGSHVPWFLELSILSIHFPRLQVPDCSECHVYKEIGEYGVVFYEAREGLVWLAEPHVEWMHTKVISVPVVCRRHSYKVQTFLTHRASKHNLSWMKCHSLKR